MTRRYIRLRRLESATRLAFGPPQAEVERLTITNLSAWRIREPDSGRRYTIVRVDSHGGVSGYGEAVPRKSVDIAEAKAAVIGRKGTALEFVRYRFSSVPALEAAIGNALVDLVARSANVPVYQYLGGPTRFKARLMARLPRNVPGESRSDPSREGVGLPVVHHARASTRSHEPPAGMGGLRSETLR